MKINDYIKRSELMNELMKEQMGLEQKMAQVMNQHTDSTADIAVYT